MFAMDRFIGVRPTEFFKFIIITSPAGLYYPKPVKVMTTQKYVRAFPGGVGFAKAAGNYGASMLPLKEAIEKGFEQILWTDGNEHKYIQEIGTMNVFFVIDGVAITPDLDGTILDGVTRDSTIQLFKHYGVKVEERKISVDEVFDAQKKGILQDAFGTGTAASIVPISHIHHLGVTIELAPISQRPYCIRFKDEMEEMKAGMRPDPFDWRVKVQSKILAEVYPLT
jgi:branched-chain amino acid aminotransferase